MRTSADDIGTILHCLAARSRRPRYAFMVLNLISEVADETGMAGPFVTRDEGAVPIREWLCEQLIPLSSRGERRRRMEGAVARAVAAQGTGDEPAGNRSDERATHERALAAGKTNISRAVTDLVSAGLLRRHYAGWCRDHVNRGGGRHAVYTVDAAALSVLRRRDRLI